MAQHFSDALTIAQRALSGGARSPRHSVVEWPVYGDCENPQYVEIAARRSRSQTSKWITHMPGNGLPRITTEMWVRCRKCKACAKYRQRVWRARMLDEYRGSRRTWFCTYTFDPEHQYRARVEADRLAAKSPPRTDLEQLVLKSRPIYSEFTRYLKRVRKNSGCQIRYVAVLETENREGDEFLHMHALVHEQGDLRYRHLQDAWRAGYSMQKLATGLREALYVSKYLTKGLSVRVRASKAYGDAPWSPLKSLDIGKAVLEP